MTIKEQILRIKVKEKELEDLLINDLEELEEDLKYLGRQIMTDSGSLDILALDREKRLVIIELKVKKDDDQLFQSIRYFDWIKSRIEWISRSYIKEGYQIDVKKDPWIFLVAPSYSDNLKKVARYVDPDLTLYEYDVIKVNDRKKVLCREINYGDPYEPVEIPTIQGHLNYIIKDDVRDILEKKLEELRSNHIELQPFPRRITLRYKGKIIGRIRCKERVLLFAYPSQQ